MVPLTAATELTAGPDDETVVVVRTEVGKVRREMIEGLKLTFTGAELVAHLAARIAYYRDATGDAESRELREAALTLIRDHIVEDEVYRLGEYDLRFADLLPEDPWLDCGCLGRWRHGDDVALPGELPFEARPANADGGTQP